MKIKSILKKKIKKMFFKNNYNKKIKIIIQKNKNIKNGHYQLNNLFNISKIYKTTPKKLAKKILKKNKFDIIKKMEFSKPCFINIFLNKKWIEKSLEKILKNKKFISPIKKKTVVIDYSSPNMAKSMHVGHLRSTIIGDSVSRIMEYIGNKVIRANHIGDWGNQFGMLIAYIKKKNLKISKKISISKIEEIYCQAKKLYDKNKKFLKKTNKYTKKLQKKEKFCYKIWKKIVKLNIKENEKIYKLLNIKLTKKDIFGESFYKKMLKKIVQDLLKRKIATIKNGNIIVFLKNFKNRKGKKMGVILKKKDGSFLYSIIDIACIKYRYEQLKAEIILYYVDSRQKQHLLQIYEISKIAGYIPNNIKVKHHIFGMMLSENNQPFQTRSGNTIKLIELIKKSIKKSKKILKEKNKLISKKKLISLSKIIGIGAIKYADLSKNRKTNYIFNWNQMLSFEGNTSLYIQYTYTRILSILRKYKKNLLNIKNSFKISNNYETILSISILQFEEIIIKSSKKGKPHLLCSYIYQLASKYSNFYEKYNILKEKNKKIRDSRLKISFLVSKILKKGLNLLGIKVSKSI
ncbi:MAG: arginine--tRNA ligase [Buchnera aphidicola (Periphyllus lyropictus)]|uniref:arginine--tRNA ligase n=1 Tax=Buchnera aphidicola TaxID=9 RepID=UPI001ECCFE57|nr:arginine--tRNA ligase [Buchnera aphidicola]NIH16628.1 arginine--tRNA ligase [Buchnera aphidicola (Periphyllus lyropictus)]USS94540.1 arginine--tRNA ligase [Buchnera aphidicola (Periphyllus lyropictus)]